MKKLIMTLMAFLPVILFAQTRQAVDLGLSVGWASCNVGASEPGDYGELYAWGEIAPKSNYSWKTLKYCKDVTGDSFSKYNRDQRGTRDGRAALEALDDAATAAWGAPWRTPTIEEWLELKDKCEWTWTTQDGHPGYKVTGPSGNSIFLPAAGCRDGSSWDDVNSWGNYWSSSLSDGKSFYARRCAFDSGLVYTDFACRYCGFSVRPVRTSE